MPLVHDIVCLHVCSPHPEPVGISNSKKSSVSDYAAFDGQVRFGGITGKLSEYADSKRPIFCWL